GLGMQARRPVPSSRPLSLVASITIASILVAWLVPTMRQVLPGRAPTVLAVGTSSVIGTSMGVPIRPGRRHSSGRDGEVTRLAEGLSPDDEPSWSRESILGA